MKPPQALNYGYRWLVPCIVALAFIGCRQANDEAASTPKQAEPSGSIEQTAEPSDELSIELGSITSEVEPDTPEPDAPSTKPYDHGATAPEVFNEGTEPKVETPPASSDYTPAPYEGIELQTMKSPAPTEPSTEEPATPSVDDSSSKASIQPPTTKADDIADEPDAATPKAPKPDLSPLGEDVEKLIRLQPNWSVWIDKDKHRVVLVGQVCQRNALLEMFACPSGTKEHEAVVAIPCQAQFVHAALLAVGAKEGKPVQFYPEYVPASGTQVDIDVRWKDDKDKVHSAKAQDWIRNVNTKKPLEHSWVFGGSSFWTDKRTGKKYYSADSGDLICVSNFPSATLDLPIESSQKEGHLVYEAFTENIPPLGTPVTVILKPKLEKSGEKKEEKNRTPAAFPVIEPKE